MFKRHASHRHHPTLTAYMTMYPMHERERDSTMRGGIVDTPSPTASSCSSGGVAGGPGGGAGLHSVSASVNGHSPLSPYFSDASFAEHAHHNASSPSASATSGMHSSDANANGYILSPQAQTPLPSSVRSPETATRSEDQSQHGRSQQQQQRLTKASHFAALFPPPRATASFTTTVSSLPTPAHSPRSAHSQSFAATHPHSSYNSHHYHPYPRTSPHSTATSTETGSGSASLSASPLGLLPSLSHSSTTSASRPGSSSDFCLTSPSAADAVGGQRHHIQQLAEAGGASTPASTSFAFDPHLGTSELPLWPGAAPSSKQQNSNYPPYTANGALAHAPYNSYSRDPHSGANADAYETYTFDDADADPDAETELEFLDSSSASPELSRGSRAHSHPHLCLTQPGTPYSPYTPYTPYPHNLPPNHPIQAGGGGPGGNNNAGYFDLLGLAQQSRHSSTARTLLQPFSAEQRTSHSQGFQYPPHPTHPYNNSYPHHLQHPHHLQGLHPGMYNDTDFDGYDSDDILSGSNVPPEPYRASSSRQGGATSASGAGKKDDKQVRRRSSKGSSLRIFPQR